MQFPTLNILLTEAEVGRITLFFYILNLLGIT